MIIMCKRPFVGVFWLVTWSRVLLPAKGQPQPRQLQLQPQQQQAVVVAQQQPCSLCRNGTAVAFPDRIVADTGVLADRTCQEVNVMLGWLYPNASHPECQNIQSLGSLCGCPTQTQNTCHLCGIQPNDDNDDQSINNHELPFLELNLGGLVPTCAMLQAYFQSVNNSADTELCLTSQYFMANYCGCRTVVEPPIPAAPCSLCPLLEDSEQGNNNTNSLSSLVREKMINIPNFPFATCGALEDAIRLLLREGSEQCGALQSAFAIYCGCQDRIHPVSPCTLCSDGRAVPWPDQEIPYLQDFFGGITPTCSVLEASLMSLGTDDGVCTVSRLTSSYCGCPAIEDHCVMCPDENRTQFPVEYHDKLLPQFEDLIGSSTSISCGYAWYVQFQIHRDDELCYISNDAAYLCGCNNGEPVYFDADTRTKRLVLVWLPRATALLSLLGSLSIAFDVLGSPVRRKKTYNRLVLGMSCTDMLVSLAWLTASAPIPRYDLWGEPERAPGAIGSTVSCKIQGFFLQLQVMSTFYNAVLSTYYLLVIVHGWSEARVARIQGWLHGVPLVAGLGLAFGALGFYRSITIVCHLQVPPFESSWFPVLFFVTVPTFIVTVAVTVMIVRVYVKVRNQQRTNDKWRFPSDEQLRVGGNEGVEPEQQEEPPPPHRRLLDAAALSREPSRSRLFPRNSTRSTTTTTKLEQQVFWQAVWYLAAFYITNVTQFTVTILAALEFETNLVIRHNLYGMWVTHVFLAPLQGLWNALIYFRPRMVRSTTLAKTRRQRRRSSNLASSQRRSSSVESSGAPNNSSSSSSSNNNRKPFWDWIFGALPVVSRRTSLSQNSSSNPPNAFDLIDDNVEDQNDDDKDQEASHIANTETFDLSGSSGVSYYKDELDSSGASVLCDDNRKGRKYWTTPEWLSTRLRREKLSWDGSFY